MESGVKYILKEITPFQYLKMKFESKTSHVIKKKKNLI